MKWLLVAALCTVALAMGGNALAETYEVTPATLAETIARLKAGDTVLLADGEYAGGITVAASGTADAPITLKATGAKALFVGGVKDGIRLEGDYIVLEGVRATGAKRGGITAGHNTGCVVRKCVSYENGVWGIFTGFADHFTVEDNECYGNKKEHGIYLSNSTDYAVVRRNHCYNNGRCGIQFNGDPEIPGGDGIMSFNLVEGNILHDNENGFNLTCVSDSVVRNNLFYGNRTKAMALWDTLAGYQYSSKRNVIINNTFVMDLCTRECIQMRNGATHNVIRNNIFVAPFQAIVADPSSIEGTVIDHNLYFGSIEPERFLWAGEYRSIKDMQEAGLSEGDLEADPKLADTKAHDYRLTADSPAIDSGVADDRAGDRDLAGQPRTSGKAIDRGAYEFQK